MLDRQFLAIWRMVGFVEGIDAGQYLTERLRKSDPESFERELHRRRRSSHRTGFLFGFVAAIVAGSLGVVAIILLAPEVAEALIVGLG
jgi:hypothetical protein